MKYTIMQDYVKNMGTYDKISDYYTRLGIDPSNPISSMYFSQDDKSVTITMGTFRFSLLKSQINNSLTYYLNRMGLTIELNDGKAEVKFQGKEITEVDSYILGYVHGDNAIRVFA
jgi:hypothetical protein